MIALTLLLAACAEPPPAADPTGEDTAADDDALVREPEICGRPTVAIEATAGGYRATTEHYTLDIAGFDAAESEDLAALAETAWAGFAAFFDAEVAGPLSATITADEVSFYAALAEDGIGEPEGAGGYYDPGTRRAYLYRQPTAYYSRVLLVHELTHQYQDHVSGTSGLPFWYVEGVAEALGRHHWDGDCLELRVRPLLSWEDAAADAQAELDAGATLEALLSGENASRPLAQELVRMLTSDPAHADGFAAWRADVAAGAASASDTDALAAHVGSLDGALEAWVPVDQEPLTPVWMDWIPEGGARAYGFSDVSSAARVKAPVDTFAMATDIPVGGGSVGTVYGYDAETGDIELALLTGDGQVSRFAVIGGVVTWDVYGAVTLDDEVAWAQVADADATRITVGDGEVSLPRALPAAGGLALYAAEAAFDSISWE